MARQRLSIDAIELMELFGFKGELIGTLRALSQEVGGERAGRIMAHATCISLKPTPDINVCKCRTESETNQ